jgi:hypothetical protein
MPPRGIVLYYCSRQIDVPEPTQYPPIPASILSDKDVSTLSYLLHRFAGIPQGRTWADNRESCTHGSLHFGIIGHVRQHELTCSLTGSVRTANLLLDNEPRQKPFNETPMHYIQHHTSLIQNRDSVFSFGVELAY